MDQSRSPRCSLKFNRPRVDAVRQFPKECITAPGKADVRQTISSRVNSGSRELGCCRELNSSRVRVKKVLELYRETLEEVVGWNKRKTAGSFTTAAMHLKRCCKWINTGKRLGSIPGVEIGDRFLCRAELNVVGLHCQFQKGIDHTKKNGISYAASIVATDRYANDLRLSYVLIYSGEGENPQVRSRTPHIRDQSLLRGNLALKNSMDSKYPVRVIRKVTSKNSSTKYVYVYDGLYMVEKYWQERGLYGKLVFRFKLERIPGQPRLTW